MLNNVTMLVSALRDIWSDIMRFLLVCILSVSFMQINAQESTDTKEDKTESVETAKKEETKKTEDITPDSFDPTEKLSEDIPVDFPVDI
jgi:hypothetical protein